MSNIDNITFGCGTCISTILFQSDLNKWRLSKLAKLDNLLINSASSTILQISKHDLIKYKNKTFPNNSHINLKPCDAV